VQSCLSHSDRMKDKVMRHFRASRVAVEIVDRKDNSARFKEMKKWMDKNLTGVQAKGKNKDSEDHGKEQALPTTPDKRTSLRQD
jgi:hypothetical protein